MRCAYEVWLRHFSHLCGLMGRIVLLMVFGCLGFSLLPAKDADNESPVVELKLSDYLQEVLQHNESIQAQMFEAEANRRKARGEYGIFEPDFKTSLLRESNQRTNNVQEQAAQSGQSSFSERNTIYDGGVESLFPTGGKIRLGATQSDLVNNVNPNPLAFLGGAPLTNFTQQYQTFVGATVTQPLLKNAGFTPTLAAIRLAALDSEIAFQQYRRQLMATIYQSEGAYWNLYYAQEQVRFFDDSVAVAQNVLDDSREKLSAGQGAELDVMEAQSALALRNTKRNDAMQNYYDAVGHLQTLTGSAPMPYQIGSGGSAIRVVDEPGETNVPLSYADSFYQAFELNPDYLIQQEKMNQENVRLGFARNQLLPELNFKAGYGYNGLGVTPGESWNVAVSQNFPSWSLGLELTVPLGGNIKGRNAYSAARLNLQQAYLNLRGAQTEIGNALNVSIQKAQAWQQSIQSYKTVVHYNEELLKTEFERLKAGTVEARKVLEVEADLLDSRQELASALTRHRRALLEVELNSGTILKQRGLDITREELKRQTAKLLEQYDGSSVRSALPH